MSLCDEVMTRTQTPVHRDNSAWEARIRDDVERYVESGGVINVVECGATADPMAARVVINEFKPSQPNELQKRLKAGERGRKIVSERSK